MGLRISSRTLRKPTTHGIPVRKPLKQGQRKSVNILPSDTVKDATAFLETFFKLYPTATKKELAYYVKDGDNLKVSVSVKYLDNKSKMTQISQYELVLHKDDNWKIVE